MTHAHSPSRPLDYANVRLRWVGTRVVKDAPAHSGDGHDEAADGLLHKGHRQRDAPVFTRVSTF